MSFFKLLLIAIAPYTPILLLSNIMRVPILKSNVVRFFKLLLIAIAPYTPILLLSYNINNKYT